MTKLAENGVSLEEQSGAPLFLAGLLVVIVFLQIASSATWPKICEVWNSRPPDYDSVVWKLRSFNAAQSAYLESHPRYGTLLELREVGLVDLSRRQFSGAYEYWLIENNDYHYQLIAIVQPNSFGWNRNYYTDETGVVRWSVGTLPDRSSPAIGDQTTKDDL